MTPSVRRHNLQLKEKLDQVRSSVHNSKSEDDLIRALDPLVEFKSTGADIRYSLPHLILSLAVTAVISLYLLVVVMGGLQDVNPIPYPPAFLVLSVFLFSMFFYLYKLHINEILELDNLIKMKDVVFDNGAKELSIDPIEEYESFKDEFFDFHRGNENQKILSKFSGEYEDERYSTSYELYTFSFVDVKTEKYNDADGMSKTKVKKTEYKRYGVVVDLRSFFKYSNLFYSIQSGLQGKVERCSS